MAAGALSDMIVPAPRARAAAEALRLGVLQFGTVQWVAQVIRNHALDAAHGFALEEVVLANNDAGRVALMAGAAEIVVSDWIFVAAQRAAGTLLRFAPFSSASGGVMVQRDSPMRSLGDLAGRKLGIAGGPVDKSWLIVRAAGRAIDGLDLASAANVVYGAPPLLSAKLLQGELDAVLTYWNFAARLEAAGYRELISVVDCARALNVSDAPSLVGFVFHEDWANQHQSTINGFLAAVSEAQTLLAQSDAEWQRIRPLMEAQDDALFANLKRRFVAGIARPSTEAQERAASQLFEVLLRTGGSRATAGIEQLPKGIFWQTPNA
jgi:NitT/TauT family transport system substrate-binding protein